MGVEIAMAEKYIPNVAKVKTADQKGSYYDEEGLYLVIAPSGTKNWHLGSSLKVANVRGGWAPLIM